MKWPPCKELLLGISAKGFGAKLYIGQIPEAVALIDGMRRVVQKTRDPHLRALAFVLLRGVRGTLGVPWTTD